MLLLAFYISINSEPIAPAPDKHGANAEIILLGAPNEKAAQLWAQNYAKSSYSSIFPDQQVKNIKLLPISDKLFTHEKVQNIDWSDVKKDNFRYDEHRYDYWSSVGIQFKRSSANDPDVPTSEAIETIHRKLGNAATEMNWDTEKQFYFLGRTQNDAYLIKSLNLMTTSIPLLKGLKTISDSSSDIELGVCPGIKEYSEQDAAANP